MGPEERAEIVEVLTLVPRDRVQQRTAEQTEDMPLFPQETGEMVRLASQERVQQRTVEQSVDARHCPNETVEVVRWAPHERKFSKYSKLTLRSVDAAVPQVMNVAVPQTQEETVEVIQLIAAERMSERILARIADVPVPVPWTMEEIVHVMDVPVP